MPVIQAPGDKLVMRNGSVSSLSRPSVPIGQWNGGGHISLSGAQSLSYADMYRRQPWVRTAIAKLNMQIARLPLKAYRMKPNGERERLRDHPLPQLLSRPYPRASAATFKQKTAFPMLLHGNSLFAKGVERAGAVPSSLIPLDWRFVTPNCDETGRLEFWQYGEDKVPLAPDSVIHFRWEAGLGDIGSSPLESLGITLRTEDSAQRHQAASFDNGVRPSTVYISEEDMDEGDKEILRQQIQAQQGGVDNAFKLALLTGGGRLETLQQTAVEAELIEQRKLNREEIAAVYDIPPPLIGILDHATYSNVAEMHRMLYGMVLGPWLTLIEETIQAQLIDTYEPWAAEGLFVEFDLAEVLKSDTLKEIQAIETAIRTGVMTPNQGLAIRNQPPSTQDGMDLYYLPANNMQPVGAQTPDAADATAFAPPAKAIIDRHIERAADRLRDKGKSDTARLERELAADLDDADLAREWAQRVEQASTPDEIRALITQ